MSPFLSTYDPVQEIPVARCCTVWTSDQTGVDYLLVGDQMLWFGTRLPNSLLNPNQIRAFGLNVFDNPFNDDEFGIDGHDAFIPFDTTGTIVHFDSRVPSAWEKTHLPIVCLTGDTWDPASELSNQGRRSREENELRMVKSLTSGMNQHQIAAVRTSEANSRIVRNGQIECELGKISSAYNERAFCE